MDEEIEKENKENEENEENNTTVLGKRQKKSRTTCKRSKVVKVSMYMYVLYL